MIGSLLTKFAMIAVTMGLVFWIGWTVPEERRFEGNAAAPKPQTVLQGGPAAQTATADVPAPKNSVGIPKPLHSSFAAGSPEQLDLNRATEQDFVALPGIGPVLAGRIVEYRKELGRFQQVEDLRDVKGIGKKKFDRIRNLVRVTIPSHPAKEAKKTT
ncbi:MAG TPA: ComEA family DNA-binding protein [Nitrospira sp.]|nr:ComEA family DNA-binding protein [Nitrospira sp.]